MPCLLKPYAIFMRLGGESVAMMGRATVFASSVLVTAAGLPCAFADPVPPEFTGVWILADSQDNYCNKGDWRGVAASESDRIVSITSSAFETWERDAKSMP
jgi:hypothetical protein